MMSVLSVLKSFSIDVNDRAFDGSLSFPTPTGCIILCVLPPIFSILTLLPITPSSIRSCVCFLNVSVTPVSNMTTL